MARVKKKGTTGQARNFITRTQAIRKLQVSLPDFRKLCIFKGIYPREPRNKKKAAKSSTPSTTFYYTKDIQYLLHEPLLQKFRDHKALSRKIARALGKDELGNAVRLEKSGVGKITLDHVIKERYPTFIDALRDLDDALSMLFLFANLPSNTTVPPKTIALCQRLCLEFQHYVIVTHSLRKSFLSIKGIYYQVTIQGQDIMWLVPHRFVQRVTDDVDFRIMGTFVEFYTTLLGFINFRLYTGIGLVYPPKFDASSDEKSGELSAFKLKGQDMAGDSGTEVRTQLEGTHESRADIQRKVDLITAQVDEQTDDVQTEVEEPDTAALENFDDFQPVAGGDVLPQPQLSTVDAGSLFAPFTFFLARETPRQPLEFILRAFGCKRIGWDAVLGDGAFTNDEASATITHQIVDKPPITTVHYDVEDGDTERAQIPPGYRVPGRIYIQPQWVWDCINYGKLLRPDLYAPGATLPPHLSPWVKPRKGAYDPSAPLEEQEREGEVEEFEEEEAEAAAIEAAQESEQAAMDASADGDMDTDIQLTLQATSEQGSSSADDDGFAAFEDEEEGEDQSALAENVKAEDRAVNLHQAELEAEAAGLPFTAGPDTRGKGDAPARSGLNDSTTGNEARKKAARRRQEEQDELQRRLGMMSRKKRQATEKALAAKGKEDREAEILRKKRRKLEKQGGSTRM